MAKQIWAGDFEGGEHLSREEFDEVFGHLIRDTSMHYTDFTDIDNPEELEEVVLDGVVSRSALTLVGLVSNESVQAKLRFVFAVYSNDREGYKDPQVPVPSLLHMLEDVVMGMQVYFRVDQADRISTDTLDVFFQAALSALPVVPLGDPHTLNDTNGAAATDGDGIPSTSRNDDDDEKSHMAIRFSDFWNWVQDTTDIAHFLDPILSSCLNGETIGQGGDVGQDGEALLMQSKLKVGDDMGKLRPKDQLWEYQLHDMIDELWTTDIPVLDADDTMVMSTLEMLVVTGRFALPVVARKLAAQAAVGAVGPGSPALAVEGIATSLAGAMRRKSSRLKGKFAAGEKLEFIGVMDLYTIMLLLAETCPDSLLMPIEPPSKIKKALNRKMSVRSSQSMIVSFLASGDRKQSSERGRRESMGVKGTSDEWQKVGELFAQMSLRTVMEKRLSLEDFLQLTAGRMEQQLLPSTKASITYKPTEILMPHSFLFSAVLMLAKGYRNIPVSFNENTPDQIDHVLSEMDFVRFYRKHPEKLLGSYRNMPVSTSGLMTIPLCIPITVNFGTALVAMSQRGLNSAALIDEDELYCGRVSQNNLLSLWWNWRLQTSRDGLTSVEALQERYTSGAAGAWRKYSTTQDNFNFFGILNQPLKHCFAVGIEPMSLRGVHQGGKGRGGRGGMVAGLNMNIITEGSESSTNSDSDSRSSSSSSSSSSSRRSSSSTDKKRKGKKTAPSSPKGRASLMKGRASIRGTPRASIRGGRGVPVARRSSSIKPPAGGRPSLLRKPSTARKTIARRKSSAAAKKLALERMRQMEESDSSSEDDDWKEEMTPEQEANRKTAKWFHDMGVIQPTDTVLSALDAMLKNNSSKTFVVDKEGSIVGAIDFMNILRKMVRFEEEASREFYFSTLS